MNQKANRKRRPKYKVNRKDRHKNNQINLPQNYDIL